MTYLTIETIMIIQKKYEYTEDELKCIDVFREKLSKIKLNESTSGHYFFQEMGF